VVQPTSDLFNHHHHHHQAILYPNLHYSLRCSLSAYTGSIYCRPQHARPSKLTVVGLCSLLMNVSHLRHSSSTCRAMVAAALLITRFHKRPPLFIDDIITCITVVDLGLGTSPGLWRVLVSILVGILMGNVTHGSGSPAKTDRWGSGCGFCGGGYPPWVPANYLPKSPIKNQIYKLNFTWI